MRILGLDIGERRIGVAISDPQGKLALPLTTLQRRDDASTIANIASLVKAEEAGALVVGLPISLNGTLGPQARSVKAFAEELANVLFVPVALSDERYSTTEAERLLRQTGYSSRKVKIRRDAMAAAIILQSYLDTKARTTKQ